MSCASRVSSPVRPVLALVPPPAPPQRPAPSRLRRARSAWWTLCGATRYRLQFVVLAAAVRRVATRQARERAWVAGFEYSFGARHSEPFWASLLDEYSDGNEAGIAASMPIWGARGKLPAESARRPRLIARVAAHAVPVTRARLAREAARQDRQLGTILDAMTAAVASVSDRAGPEPAPRAPLVLVSPSAWQEETS